MDGSSRKKERVLSESSSYTVQPHVEKMFDETLGHKTKEMNRKEGSADNTTRSSEIARDAWHARTHSITPNPSGSRPRSSRGPEPRSNRRERYPPTMQPLGMM